VKDFGYDKIFNQVPESMVILNGAGEILFFNKSALKFQHLLKKELQPGVRFTDMIASERRDLVNSILENVKTDKKSQTSEAEYKDPAGRSFFFEVTYHPIVNNANDTQQICVISREITHEKTFERKTLELVNELSNLIENANALIFSVDSREYVTEWNKECTRLTAFEKNDILARKVDLMIDEMSKDKMQYILQCVLKNEPVSNQELLIRTKAGNSMRALVNATPKVNSTKNVIGVLFVGQDITELSNYRQSLEEKVRDRTEQLKQALEKEKEFVELKNRFVSVASHEFKMPLSSITAAVNAIRKHGDLASDDLAKLENIDKQAGYMKSLLEDILSLKKSETNQLKPDFRTVDLTAFLEKIIQEVLDSTQHTHFITTEFIPEHIEIETDEKLLKNIFVNLISNAVKFSPQERQVDVVAWQNENAVVVTVKDHGIGIEKKDISRVFEPFNRGSNVSEIKGTGLGLSIVKRAVEAMGGNIFVESEPGKGTTMTVHLKVKQFDNQ
jgi:PAS domain S-box-containing protein